MSEKNDNSDSETEKNEAIDQAEEKIEKESINGECLFAKEEKLIMNDSKLHEAERRNLDMDIKLVAGLKENIDAKDSDKNEEANAKNEQKDSLGNENMENGNDLKDEEVRTAVDAEDKRNDETALIEKGGKKEEDRELTEKPFRWDPALLEDEDGTEEEQAAFMKDLEDFHKEMYLEFKPPKFYGEGLNCLKLWRAVTRLGGYEQVTSCKLWRQVGESFHPPKTCTTISWSFRIFYEKALLEYEKHKILTGELHIPATSLPEPLVYVQVGGNQTPASGRGRRDAAARAMQGWHSRLLGNGEVGVPIAKDRTPLSLIKGDKYQKTIGGMKRKTPIGLENAYKVSQRKAFKPQGEAMVVDIGEPAEWVKINVKRTKDCFEVYALVPGLLREEVHVQSDPAGRLIISGDPDQPDNPWGVTPFKKVVTLPSRIDPHQTSAVVTLHGQLFVRVPFELSD